MITPRKRRIVEALKPHLRYGPKTALVDAVDALLEEAERDERKACEELCRILFTSGRTNADLRALRIAAAIRARGQGQAEAAE